MIEMAGHPPRPTSAYADERRRPPESHRPQQEADRARDRGGAFSSRNPPIGPARRDSRDARDPRDDRDARDDISRRQQNARPIRSPRRASSFTGTSSTASTVEKPKPTRLETAPQSPAKPPSRHVVPNVASKFKAKAPRIENEEHQPLFSALWALTEITEDRVSVKSQLSTWEATLGVRDAYNTKLEKADEGTSGAFLYKTQMRQQAKDDKVISEKVSESTERKRKALERAIVQLAALQGKQSKSTEPLPERSESNAAVEKQIAELHSKFAEQQQQMIEQGQKLLLQGEKLVAQDEKLSEQDRQYNQSQVQLQQMKEQQTSAIRNIEALQKENETLRQQLSKQIQEVSDGLNNQWGVAKNETEFLKAEVQRSCEHSRNAIHKMEVAHAEQVESTSQTFKKHTSMMDAMDKALKMQGEMQVRLKEDVNNLQSTSKDLVDRVSSNEESTRNVLQKVEALDFESLDEMINQWFDKNVPEQIKRYAEICNDIAAIKQSIHKSGPRVSPDAVAISSVTESHVDTKLGALYDNFEKLVTDSTDALGEMIDEISKDVQELKTGDLGRRIAALEAKPTPDPKQAAIDPMVSQRLKTLEDQQLDSRVQATLSQADQLAARVQALEGTTHQAIRQELQPFAEKLEGVAMQANVLDTQFKNLSTKEMGQLILREVQNVSMGVSDHARRAQEDAKRAIEDTQKLNNRVDTLQLGLTKIKNMQDGQRSELRELSVMVDVAVRNAAGRAGEKRGSEGIANGEYHENKRQKFNGAGRGGA